MGSAATKGTLASMVACWGAGWAAAFWAGAPGGPFCHGARISFTSRLSNGGYTPSLEWETRLGTRQDLVSGRAEHEVTTKLTMT